jgi:hypothetical protein
MSRGKPRPGPTPRPDPRPTGGKPIPLDPMGDGVHYGQEEAVYRPAKGVPTPDDEDSPDA